MSRDPINVIVTDPRTYLGNPYEVAERAVEETKGLVRLVELSLEDANVMARNAYMQRRLTLGEASAGGDIWPFSAEGRKFGILALKVQDIAEELSVLARAAAYDPKAR